MPTRCSHITWSCLLRKNNKVIIIFQKGDPRKVREMLETGQFQGVELKGNVPDFRPILILYKEICARVPVNNKHNKYSTLRSELFYLMKLMVSNNNCYVMQCYACCYSLLQLCW